MSAAIKINPDQQPETLAVSVPNVPLQRAQRRMIAFMSAAVLVLGFVISFDMLQPPAGLEMPAGSKVGIRNPASVAGTELVAPDQAVDVQTDCNPVAEIEIPPFVNQVRLIGSACSRKTVFEASEIHNVTNGYAATVFYPTPTDFTTDYISLSKDENLIHITHFMKKAGRETRELRIRRR